MEWSYLMSRKKRRKNKCSDLYWQSADYTERVFWMFKKQIIRLAISRFKWVGLPPTCDKRYLEFSLLFEGQATIAFPKKQPGIFYSTKAVTRGRPNVYDNPSSWDSFGNNNWRFRVTPKNGVMIYENLERMPVWDLIDIYARELTDLFRTRQINRFHQKIPMLLKGDQTKEFDMINIFKNISGYEPAVITTNSIDLIDIEAIKTGIPFIGAELHDDMMSTWNDVYTMLGISNIPYKSERQIESEVRSYKAPTTLIALNSLDARREACDKLNSRFNQFLNEPVRCVWNEDIESTNYNAANNIETMAGLIDEIRN